MIFAVSGLVSFYAAFQPALGSSMNITGGQGGIIRVSALWTLCRYRHNAHEMLHHGDNGSALPKVVRETQAEAVAYVVSHAIGLETNKAAADYVVADVMWCSVA